MADTRFAGNAIRRRMGAPSSTLGMVDDADGQGPEMAGFNQQLEDMAQLNPPTPMASVTNKEQE